MNVNTVNFTLGCNCTCEIKAQLPLIKLQKAQKVFLEILNYCHVGYPLIDVGVRLITADRKCITENAKMPRNAASFRK